MTPVHKAGLNLSKKQKAAAARRRRRSEGTYVPNESTSESDSNQKVNMSNNNEALLAIIQQMIKAEVSAINKNSDTNTAELTKSIIRTRIPRPQ